MSSTLNVNATEWKPSGTTPYSDGFSLPEATLASTDEQPSDQATNRIGGTGGSAAGSPAASPALTAQQQQQYAAGSQLHAESPAFIPSYAPAMLQPHLHYPAAAAYGMVDLSSAEYYPPFLLSGGERGDAGSGAAADGSDKKEGADHQSNADADDKDRFSIHVGPSGAIDWALEFQKIMRLTEKMIQNQLDGGHDEETGAAPAAAAAAAATTAAASTAGGKSGGHSKKSPAPAAAAATHTKEGGKKVAAPTAANLKKVAHQANAYTSHPTQQEDKGLPPLTANGNRRWKRPTKAQQRREEAQKHAFEAFASALLHTVSPFMAPLRARCHSSLPHLKLDQRFGKSGQPQTAIAQFVVAPLITTYRPRHFHDLSPGDLLEYHYELSLVLQRGLQQPRSLILGYGPVWKRYAVPFAYISCAHYAKEVLALCPEEVPNVRAEAMYEDDVVKSITEVVLAVEELEFLQHMSLLEAMNKRMDLSALYDVFNTIFAPIENYQIEMTGLDQVPSQFFIKASNLELQQRTEPIVLYDDPDLWEELETVSRVVLQQQRQGGDGAGAGAAAASSAGGDHAAPKTASNHHHSTNGNNTNSSTSALHPHGEQEKKKKGHIHNKKDKNNNNNSDTGVNWSVVAPLVLSCVCIAATAGVIMAKKKK